MTNNQDDETAFKSTFLRYSNFSSQLENVKKMRHLGFLFFAVGPTCLLFIAAVTNQHKPSGLKQQFYSSGGQKSKMGSQDPFQSVLPGSSREKCVSLPISAFRSSLHSLAHGPFLSLQTQQYNICTPLRSLFLLSSSFFFLLPLSFTYKNTCDYTELTWISQDNISQQDNLNLITFAQS